MQIEKEMVGTMDSADLPKDAVISEKTVDGTKYISYLISNEYSNLNDLQKALTLDSSDIKQFENAIFTKDTFEGS